MNAFSKITATLVASAALFLTFSCSSGGGGGGESPEDGISSSDEVITGNSSSSVTSTNGSSSSINISSSSDGILNSSSSEISISSSSSNVESSSSIEPSSSSIVLSSSSIEQSSSSNEQENSSSSIEPSSSSLEEIESVTIGTQVWMKKNLDVAGGKCYGEGKQVYIRDGSTFAELTATEIQANCATYGKLYDFNTAKTACPSGWKLPSREEWKTLNDNIKSASNNSMEDFIPLLGGSYDSEAEGGVFYDIDRTGAWWGFDGNDAMIQFMREDYDSFSYDGESDGVKKTDLHSVRCIKD